MDTDKLHDAEVMRREIVAILPRLRRFCLALARNADRADDLCHSTIERALSRSEQFRPDTRLDSWLYRIAQNIHIDQGRRERTRGIEIDIDEVFALGGCDGLQVMEGRSDLYKARQAMANLPEDQRELLNLVVIDGMAYKDAAHILKIPIGTVMSRLARARRSINRALTVSLDERTV